jgi:hypothetical protein
MGGNLSALVTRLKQTEEHRRRLLQQREEVRFALPAIDWRLLERQAREKLASWRMLATQHVSGGRQLLQALPTEPLVFTPFDEGSARGYRFRGRATLDGLIEGVVNVVKVYSTQYTCPS